MSDELFQVTHTKIQSFTRCRKQYWFSYVSGLDWPPSRDTPAAIVGKGVHRAMRVLCETGYPEDAEHELDVYLRMPKHELTGPGTEYHRLAFELLANGVAAHESIVSEDRYAELNTWVRSASRGITVRAAIDRADRLDAGHWLIIDWKTGRFDLDEIVDAQLDIGHLALRTSRKLSNDTRVTAIGWNLRSGVQRVRELTRDDAKKTVDYLANLAARLRTTEEFPATPGPQCTFCDWRDRCEEANDLERVELTWLDDDWERGAEPF